jgi:hypothetical protein
VQDSSSPASAAPPPKIDTTVAHSARIWNYWLGGKDNFAADRVVGDQVFAMLPSIVEQARADRAFLARAVRHMVAEAGIRQFLDVGTGLPTANNTHEVAQALAPSSRIVYVDNDPMVLVHARALLTSAAEGSTDYMEADLSEPDKILRHAANTLDFTQPIALMLLGVLHHIPSSDEAYAVVGQLLAALPPGSYLAINHGTNAIYGEASDEGVRHWNKFGKPTITLRSPQEIARFFDGLELLEPGVVSCSRWRPGPGDLDTVEVDEFCGVGRKP